jgi:hydrogenase expression/formation protein HypD
VTPLQVIDKALEIASRPEVIFCSFGDMLRVPGSKDDLFKIRGSGGDVRVVYSPLDALRIARENPDREVVFLAIGFETTAPANAMAIKLAKEQRIDNFSALVSHVLVPPAIEAIMNSPGNRVNAFLAAGHVCCVTGFAEYPNLCRRYQIPIVVTGFEPLDLLEGIRRTVRQLENGESYVENAYGRVVSEQGNLAAQAVIDEVFEVTDRGWRGIGTIPRSGWSLREEYSDLDAERRFTVSGINTCESSLCRAGDVLKGAIKPNECEAFGKECTPRNPLGATMVSSEGACAAYFNYGRFVQLTPRKSTTTSGAAK